MLRLTLDTGCVISAAQDETEGAWIDELVELAHSGRVELWLTLAYAADQERATPARQGANLEWLSERPVLGPVPGPFVIGYSRLDGGDVIADDEVAETSEKIREVMGVKLPSRPDDAEYMESWARKWHDVQHLLAHHMAGHDAFVTLDHRDILRRADDLLRQTGIIVVSPEQAAAMVVAH